MIGDEFTVDWRKYLGANWDDAVDTTISPATAAELGKALTTFPPDMKLHGRVQRVIDERRNMAAGKADMDWGFAESMAYASLIRDGVDCRLVGQDSGRGTFFHRHAVLHNQLNNREYTPLQHLVDRKDAFRVIDSLLSEEVVLAFEYGYATTEPETLVIWEGQFGDFVNGAQVVIDQFISSGEAKWGRLCGMTLFYRTVMRVRDRSIRQDVSSDSCSSARSTICRYASRRHLRRCFTCCDDRWCVHFVSRSLL